MNNVSSSHVLLCFIHLATCFSHAQAEAKQVKRWRRCRRSWEIISLHLFRSVRMPELEGYSAKHAPGSQNCLQVMFLQLARIGRNRWDGQRSCRDWRWWAFVFAGKNAFNISPICVQIFHEQQDISVQEENCFELSCLAIPVNEMHMEPPVVLVTTESTCHLDRLPLEGCSQWDPLAENVGFHSSSWCDYRSILVHPPRACWENVKLDLVRCRA